MGISLGILINPCKGRGVGSQPAPIGWGSQQLPRSVDPPTLAHSEDLLDISSEGLAV